MLFNISYFISIYNDEGGIESEVPVCKSKGFLSRVLRKNMLVQ